MNPYLIEGPALISFSGGRTSAYMLRQIIDAYGGTLPATVIPCFSNTGKEMPETLDFVAECGERWGTEIVWLEYDPEGEKQRKFRTVSHATASRDGEPFEALIRQRKYLPNPVARFCTEILKIRVMRDYALSLGWEEWSTVVGLRYDEPRRVAKIRAMNERWEKACPLFDAKVTKQDVTAFWNARDFDLRLPNADGKTPHGNCDLCLAGETEVATSQGIRQIRDLVGTEPELLVPKLTRGYLCQTGHFVKAPVRSFGVQQLWQIDLVRKRSRKVVYATADHRWFLTPVDRSGRERDPVPTSQLRPGNRLKNLLRCPVGEHRGKPLKIGAMRGFVFGDGTHACGGRPGTLNLYEGKDEVFLPLFTACCDYEERRNSYGTRFWEFYGLPRDWKSFPDLKESRSFLMGWLSGWFAADGHVSEDGNCILAAADPSHLEFARSVCAVLGVQCSPPRVQDRVVRLPQGKLMASPISFLNLNRHHLPTTFFWLAHHRSRFVAAARKTPQRLHWVVERVLPTDRYEEVFCATVKGPGAFALADDLMTGNCYLKSAGIISALIAEDPSRADWWARMESIATPAKPSGARFRNDRPGYREMKEAVLAQRSLDFGEVDALSECFCHD